MGHPETVDYGDCTYCSARAEYYCSSCNRPLCEDHGHRAEGEVFCEPLPDETVKRYRLTGRVPDCEEGVR